MRITKYEHATLQLALGDESLVIDPGVFLSHPDITGVVAIVITHEHTDHWTAEQVRRILEKNPDAKVFAPQGVADQADGLAIEVVAPGDTAQAGPFALEFFGGKHAVIHESIPVIDNVGVLVNDELYYAGDSYAVPGVEVGTLAAPIGAPWLKIGEAMDYVLAVKPKRAFYVHDMTLSVAGKQMAAARLAWATEQGGGTFTELQPGETLDV
ncbi:MBL fold metallo-hydrolase [Pseudolysinimonas yzui]|uniref:MBL fold metallo-hydrolase n=1 Tax=Pseudolysinimonas yzui TaxID=2708254 RepID=A0A8J3GN14_9MICO|nr:MBL fold metallo-hydrolase [Pseudolysinimonas yzui]GHF05568.1 MBL fold metallo-hydrolase [Pseudolysinimonas yzui]